MRLHTLFLGFAYVLISCSAKSTSSTETIVSKLLGHEVLFDDLGLGNPEHILFQENKLIVTKNLPEELILVYDLSSGNRTVKGQYGEGPGEIRSPWSVQRGDNSGEFWVASIGQKRLSRFGLNSDEILAEEQIKLTGEAVIVMEPLALSDEEFIGTSLDGKSILTLFNGDGQILNRLGEWSAKTDFGEYPSHVISALYEGRLRANNTKVLYSCIALDRFMVLDMLNDELNEYKGPFNIEPEFGTVPDRGMPVFAPSPDTKFGFIDSYLSNDYIYLLYSGLSPKEITQTGKMANDLLVYDLEGNLLHHFLLDMSLKAFSIDETSSTIYGLTSYMNDDAKVVRFGF